ncbi:hypothetical protein SPFL3102_02712 [Sporomusaceae bacterium FL31]|nr:hypothetical protein SPFL3101_02687 [Sporomusaceae bacterium FL31]GCE34884.1 hypothetical protein SPFL3102_02712 [Sporomusaceae bacterium]
MNIQVKKSYIVLVAMVTAIGISDKVGNVAYASTVLKAENSFAAVEKDQLNANFAYEMAQITAKVIAVPTTNTDKFKVEFTYAMAQATAKMLPLIPSSKSKEFSYEMAQITTKIINAPNLDVENAKAEFAYKMALLTTQIITNEDPVTSKSLAGSNQSGMLRNNADIETTGIAKLNSTTAVEPKASAPPADLAPETYAGLIEELTHVGDRSKQQDNKVNIDGELRAHYAINNGSGPLDRDSTGIRARLAFDTALKQDWRAYGMFEGQRNISNYNNEFNFSRFYVAGRSGTSMLTAGSFGYLMAGGNIYDSDFAGIRAVFNGPVKYTASYGKTDETKETAIIAARYEDYDYDVEAAIYHYRMSDGLYNTIRTLGGTYNFSNFGIGAMVLDSSLKDSKGASTGYVFHLNYGDLKTWRPGTYGVFAKYYNQPRGTYIVHGMNGKGGSMQGFKGFGLGMNYTLAENFVAGIEYYDLKDHITGGTSTTWWNQLTYYF